ncbi:YiiX/YebB-like N1pC/P60 family cysteine hydrolase [Deefgea rivuli]|uniref:YiiX/YebB-like N1pC/P60 family cysteine hydrolase n=1 Tax=Deefgea rivuli TaxID=400948 RepID=UPI0006870849|nr:YiiX/YebB-like N1pC/P60 family cysteine hydrolase [Deefgea rivuli]
MLRWLLCAVLLIPLGVFAAEENHFAEQINQLINLRSQAYQFAQEHQISEQKSVKLTRAQSNQMRDMAQRYIQLRGEILPYAEAVAPLFQADVRLKLSSEKPTNAVDFKRTLPLKGATYTLVINPNDAAGQQVLQDIQQGLAAALVLMDSYQIAIEPYANNPALNYLLTYDVGKSVSLRQLASNYHSSEFRTRLLKATQFVDQLMAERREQGINSSVIENDYYALSQSTIWYVSLHQSNQVDVADTLQYLVGELGLQQQSIQNTLSYGLSMGFGNMAGLAQTRKGKLTRLPASEVQALENQLKPLDILLEKTPFRLTDKMIPGHYGHVAVWLGSEAELRAMGIWDEIAPAYQAKIRNGGRIVEALRSGVTISSLEQFLNIDDLLVLRESQTPDVDYQHAAILTALAQVGKEYDFNFDVLTHERIVCSELAYVVFPELPWPISKALGRYTISPDNVAQLAVNDEPILNPVILYRDGVAIKTDLRETLSRLINPKTTLFAKQ